MARATRFARSAGHDALIFRIDPSGKGRRRGLELEVFLIQLAKAVGLTHQQRPPCTFGAVYSSAFGRDQLAPAEVPALPRLTRQLGVADQAQQLVDRIRHLVGAAQPVL